VDERVGGRSEVRSWSRREAARYDVAEERPAERVGADEPLRPRQITRERDDGTYEALAVSPETEPRADRERRPLFLQRQGDVAVLRVRTLGMALAEVEASLDEIAKALDGDGDGGAANMIVDLRGNPGGRDKVARAIAARLIDRAVTGGQIRVRLSKWARDARAEWRSLAEDPARPGWSLPDPVRAEPAPKRITTAALVALIDAGCRSSCEALALLLRAARVPLIGERTGGSSGAPFEITLPHSRSRVTVSGWAMFDASGAPIEGLGIAPDETVLARRADIALRRDPAFARAVARLGRRVNP
jgi:C-terminal processing protease CtpA/Prc